MNSNNSELGEQLEMVPTWAHSTTWRPNTHTHFIRLGRRYAARCGIAFLLTTAIVSYLFWARISLSHSHTGAGTNISAPIRDSAWLKRAVSVKEAFLHAYGGYENYTTFPDDELRPISNTGQRKWVSLLPRCYCSIKGHNQCSFNGWGVTTVDSLDTMWLMGEIFHSEPTLYSLSALRPHI
jgi:mannosyl-oligosaccharide alpha-1,2-mannosidase